MQLRFCAKSRKSCPVILTAQVEIWIKVSIFPFGRNASKILFKASNNDRTDVLCATESDVFSPSAFLMHAQSDQTLNLLYLGGKVY